MDKQEEKEADVYEEFVFADFFTKRNPYRIPTIFFLVLALVFSLRPEAGIVRSLLTTLFYPFLITVVIGFFIPSSKNYFFVLGLLWSVIALMGALSGGWIPPSPEYMM